ncbi:MAG: hypothetical protein AAGF28_12085 [Pseudomonadota bacterium]
MTLINSTPYRPRVIKRGYVQKLLLRLLHAWKQRQKHRVDRLAFENLMHLDDATLADIGYRREDVVAGMQMPLEMNAAMEIHRQSRRLNQGGRFRTQ